MRAQVITANRLVDGRVVYLAADGWTDKVDAARQFATPAEAETAVAAAKAGPEGRALVDVYALEVDLDGGAVHPLGQRETIRTRGPSVRTDLGYQAGNP